MRLEGKRIVVTGASSGIGLESILLMAKYKDTKILAVDYNETPELSKAVETHSNIRFIKMDVSIPENIESILEHAKEWMGGLDIFFANAGFAYYEEIQKPSWYRIEKIFHTNVFSPLYTVTYLNYNLKNQFLFIVTASAMSHLPIPGYSLYAATKAAVHSFMSCFRFELKKGNRIMVVYPIATRTKFFDKAGNAVPIPFPSQTPRTVAKSIIRGIRLNKKEVYPSKIFQWMKLLDRFLFYPLKIYQKIEGIKFKKYQKKINPI